MQSWIWLNLNFTSIHISDYYQCSKQLLLHNFMETWCIFIPDVLMNGGFKMEIFCNIINVSTVTFDLFNARLRSSFLHSNVGVCVIHIGYNIVPYDVCVQNAIANATSLAEVERLKGLLQSGHIPGRELRSGMTFNMHLHTNIFVRNDGKSAGSWLVRSGNCWKLCSSKV